MVSAFPRISHFSQATLSCLVLNQLSVVMQAARQGGDMASAMLEAQAKRDATKKLREEGKKPIGLPQKRGA